MNAQYSHAVGDAVECALMPRIAHHAVDVAAKPADCWRAVLDLASWPRWFPYLRSARMLDGDGGEDWRIGQRIRMVFALGPVRVPVTSVVEELEAERIVRWVGKGFGVTGNHAYTIEVKAPGATRVTSHEEFSGPAARLMTSLIFDRIDREAHESMARFKALVEGAA
jgi:hypothetical protein